MVLKRKRSLSELCGSPSSTTSSSSNFSFQSPSPRHAISARASFASPAHLNSRTMKRFRDNRPSEEEIHQRTLDVLFAAQRQQPRPAASAPQQPQQQQQQQLHEPSSPGNQQSLHRFWNIGSAPTTTKSVQPVLRRQNSIHTNCDDCGTTLGGGDEMELDGFEGDSNSICGACGKHVCFSCSVSSLGEDKRCLQCAGREVPVGGIGWASANANANVSVC